MKRINRATVYSLSVNELFGKMLNNEKLSYFEVQDLIAQFNNLIEGTSIIEQLYDFLDKGELNPIERQDLLERIEGFIDCINIGLPMDPERGVLTREMSYLMGEVDDLKYKLKELTKNYDTVTKEKEDLLSEFKKQKRVLQEITELVKTAPIDDIDGDLYYRILEVAGGY